MEDSRVSPYPLRLEPDLRERLQRRADMNGIPLSQEILSLLAAEGKAPPLAREILEAVKSLEDRINTIESQQKEILDLIKSLRSDP